MRVADQDTVPFGSLYSFEFRRSYCLTYCEVKISLSFWKKSNKKISTTFFFPHDFKFFLTKSSINCLLLSANKLKTILHIFCKMRHPVQGIRTRIRMENFSGKCWIWIHIQRTQICNLCRRRVLCFWNTRGSESA